ncbi:MAG: 3-dehydroquinate synthase [Candidatus Margulisbacteria bacterium]|jgi:3-dehydroquinate synthase|nr:3-dehydroquinate synthase [Candidatus Margulisiibacteriota bacterium]
MPVAGFTIHSRFRDYPVEFSAAGGLSAAPGEVCVVDANVWRLHSTGLLAGLPADAVISFPVSEERKTLAGAQELYDRLIERAPKKNTALLVIGGGILQDIAGFVASTLYRGINWRFWPTTLLAQGDSCIGAKTSLNYRGFKNLLGTFFPPAAVTIEPGFLATQAEADYLSGVGEIVKLHLIGGKPAIESLTAGLAGLLRRDRAAASALIKAALLIKKSYIEDDELDAGRRNLLNFGHCFGHALEAASDYAVPHGQAVVLGIILANSVAVQRGLLSTGRAEALRRELLAPIVAGVSRRFDPERVIAAMRQDKKRTGAGLAIVLLKDDGSLIRANDLSDSEAATVLGGWQ